VKKIRSDRDSYKQLHVLQDSPPRHIFTLLIIKARETGIISPQKPNPLKMSKDKSADVAVLSALANYPHLSAGQTESYSGISKASVHCIIKCQVLHLPRTLTPGSTWKRFSKLCTIFSFSTTADLLNFFQNVLFTDGATFTNDGQVNTRNVNYWNSFWCGCRDIW
jgi:hypothetical protein